MIPVSRRTFAERVARAGLALATTPALSLSPPLHAAAPAPPVPPGPAVAFPGPWQFQLPKGAIILVSDQQLEDLTDPDKEVDLSLSATPDRTTLRQLCERHRAAGARTLVLAFDEFWSQYRKGQGGKPRQFTPDTEGAIQRIARIGATLQAHGLGMELSLLSPLEIGTGYSRETGESGRWVHYREGWRDPKSGRYSVALWEQLKWTNNKGTVPLRRSGVRVFAFRERRLGNSRFYVVDPSDIRELPTAPAAEHDEPSADGKRRRLTIRGAGDADLGPLDRVLVVVSYAVPEMDYFSPKALPYLEALVRRYHAAGVPLHGLYADEMHIQQDWGYASHHEEGQFALRYLTPNLARAFAARYGAEFADLDRYLVYFACSQHGFLPDLQARLHAQHVLGPGADGLHRTWLLRRRYFALLHDSVVELFARAKASAETLYGRPLEARAHATWAQSPTIDFWQTGNHPLPPRQYEYTPDFLWSNTVQQAASACSDYFKWNEFLTGGGNDHAEGGWSDRNYYGLALACSTGSLNAVPNAYAAAWGMPADVLRRHRSLENAFGCSPDPEFAAVCAAAHRSVPVLFLYPSSLVASDERFGSWMVQYGYANYVTPEKLLEHARLTSDGQIDLLGRRYGTLAILFEPLPPTPLLPLLERFTEAGGRLIWSGPPPVFDLDGQPIHERWRKLCGLAPAPPDPEGLPVPGRVVTFLGPLAAVPSQAVLTDFLVDLAWPCSPAEGAQTVARIAGQPVGVHRTVGIRGGTVTRLGFRPRDDQAASLGEECRTWFEILRALGAYAGADDPSVVSRTTPWFAAAFPNGALALAAHYRTHIESWPGGFHRDAARDTEILRQNPPPPEALELDALAVSGRRITYRGQRAVAFRMDSQARLAAFAGFETQGLRVDDREYRAADRPLAQLAWAPLHPSRRTAAGAVLEVWVRGTARVRIPLVEAVPNPRLHLAGPVPGSLGAAVRAVIAGGHLEFDAHPGGAQGLLYLLA